MTHQFQKTGQPLGALAYDAIYRKIMILEYAPGQRLEEQHLVTQLGIGRTPVREALQRLANDFMVESHHNKGFEVRPITLQNIKAAFAALKILELGVAELAVRRDVGPLLEDMSGANDQVSAAIAANDVLGLVEANSRFHQLFAQASGNDYLIRGLHKVRCETDRLAYLSFNNAVDPLRSQQEHYRSVVDQHSAIIEGIARRRESPLKKTLIAHIQAFQNRILLYMAS
ncbi:MAG: GntR family transcriptional regulator [Pseudomonadota bacterium]